MGTTYTLDREINAPVVLPAREPAPFAFGSTAVATVATLDVYDLERDILRLVDLCNPGEDQGSNDEREQASAEMRALLRDEARIAEIERRAQVMAGRLRSRAEQISRRRAESLICTAARLERLAHNMVDVMHLAGFYATARDAA